MCLTYGACGGGRWVAEEQGQRPTCDRLDVSAASADDSGMRRATSGALAIPVDAIADGALTFLDDLPLKITAHISEDEAKGNRRALRYTSRVHSSVKSQHMPYPSTEMKGGST